MATQKRSSFDLPTEKQTHRSIRKLKRKKKKEKRKQKKKANHTQSKWDNTKTIRLTTIELFENSLTDVYNNREKERS